MALIKGQSITSPNFDNIPKELKLQNQWLLWRAEPNADDPNKLDKIPYSTFKMPLTRWSEKPELHSFAEIEWAYRQSNGFFTGIGFRPQNTPFQILDLDSDLGIDDLNQVIKAFALETSYCEKSPSGKGLHMVVRGEVPATLRRKKAIQMDHETVTIEFFTGSGWTTFTGDRFNDKGIENDQQAINWLIEKFDLVEEQIPTSTPATQTTNLTAGEVRDIIGHSASASAQKLNDLLEKGHSSEYAKGDPSATDAMVTMSLIFWCQGDQDLIRELLESSALQREKWTTNKKYLERTITNALKRYKGDYYQPALKLGWNEETKAKIGDMTNLAVAQLAVNTMPEFDEILAYDEFTRRIIFVGDPTRIGVPAKIGDPLLFKGREIHTAKISTWFTQNYKKAIPAKTWEEAIEGANLVRFDSAIDWITKDSLGNPLEWDGKTDYIGDCAVNILKAKDTELSRATLRAFLCNLVNRVVNGKHRPTFYKFALVLYGAQNAGKSNFLSKLAGDFFTDEIARFGLESPRANTLLKKSILVEMGETWLFKKSDIEMIKAFIVQKILKGNDFGNAHDENFNLRHVIAITANKIDFVKDATGASRFYPIEVSVDTDPMETGKLVADLTENDIKNMFAQAIALLERDGFEALKLPKELDKELNEERQAIQYTSKYFAILKDYLETEFPIDTFTGAEMPAGKMFLYQRHKNDWNLIDQKGEWSAELYYKLYGNTDKGERSDDLPRSVIDRVSVKELCDVLEIDPADNSYSFQDLENDLAVLGFVKEKGRKFSRFGSKRSDTWARSTMPTGSGYVSPFIKPE